MKHQETWTLWGGGLANCLLALRLQEKNLPFRIIERSQELAGDHTWSFHEGDLNSEDFKFVEPFVGRSWPGYKVKFSNYDREFKSHYFTIRSADLRKVLRSKIPDDKIQLNSDFSPTAVQGPVIDARGFSGLSDKSSGWQKFVGWDVRFDKAHGLNLPIVMDATVEQIDGYRFVYVLPLDEHTLLIEDTRYSNSRQISEADFATAIKAYIEKNWPNNAWSVVRSEQAALPIPLQPMGHKALFGVGGGFFHPVTGYSLPYAVQVSRKLIDLVELGHPLPKVWNILHQRLARNENYYLQLNRMMFLAAEPSERWRIFDRFYRLDEKLIQRFYSGRSSTFDKIRIVAGKPPVSISAAIKALTTKMEAPAWN